MDSSSYVSLTQFAPTHFLMLSTPRGAQPLSALRSSLEKSSKVDPVVP